MKKNGMNSIMILLIGIVIGFLVTFVTISFFKGDNKTSVIDKEKKSVIESNKEEIVKVDPVNYFTNIDNSNDEQTIKQGFIKIVDFLFYDSEINGTKFSELKDEAKIKIMKIAYSIDNKIDNYFPDYKESIASTSKKIYKDIKIKTTELYLDVTNKICESNDKLCLNAKKDFESIKESFGLTYDFLSNLSKDGLDKIKDWYENFRQE